MHHFQTSRRSIEAEHIDRLSEGYKAVCAHLTHAQTYYPSEAITASLNQLATRLHHTLHAQQTKTVHPIGDFFKRRFIQCLAERRYAILLAAALLIAGGIVGFASVWSNPLNLYDLVPASIATQIDPDSLGEGHGDIMHATMSTSIMTNNIRVAILAFVSGITFGLLTVYILFYNGLLVGALAGIFWHAGQSYAFWAYILPHGVIELTAIFIAGGAGLHMGYRLINPGQYTRKYRFLTAVRESALLLIGTLPLFVIAGLIEGYLTPSSLSLATKYGIAFATLLLLAAYIIYGLRLQRR